MSSRVTMEELVTFLILKILLFTLITGQVQSSNVSQDVIPGIDLKINWDNPFSVRAIGTIQEFQPDKVIHKYVNLNKQSSRDREISACDAQLTEFVSGLAEFETWALKMFDSSSKIPSGILIGNNRDLGIYDECISVELQKEVGLIRGRYCTYSLSLDTSTRSISLDTTLAICLPSACNAQSLTGILQNAMGTASDDPPFDVKVRNVTCLPLDSPPFETGEIITITIFSIYICFLVGCTICDILVRTLRQVEPESIINEFCRFSLYTNLKQILNTKEPQGNIAAVQGLRFFSLCWVILGHEYSLQLMKPTINMADVPTWMNSWGSIYMGIAPFAVDTFFTLSGFLTSYLFLKEMAKGRTFNPLMYYLHRYIRLTPSFGALILLTIYVFPRWGSGPIWESVVYHQKETCEEHWWPMMIYVHNYVNAGILGCLTHTWYLAVDMQLFWISPLILYPLAKKPKLGLAILAASIVVSIVLPAAIAAVHEYSGAIVTTFINLERAEGVMTQFYMASHARAGPWLLGVLLGYLLSKYRHIRFSLMRAGWIATLLAFAFIFFTYRIFQTNEFRWNAPWEVFYVAVARHIWAFGVCWLIYASVLGYAGIVGRILSLSIFIPFGRISYCVYLIHFMILILRIGSSRAPVYFTDQGIIYLFLAEWIISTLGGLAMSLIFESPFMTLEKMILREKLLTRKQKKNDGSSYPGQLNGVHNQGYRHDNA